MKEQIGPEKGKKTLQISFFLLFFCFSLFVCFVFGLDETCIHIISFFCD